MLFEAPPDVELIEAEPEIEDCELLKLAEVDCEPVEDELGVIDPVLEGRELLELNGAD